MNNKFGVVTNDPTVSLYLSCYDNIEVEEIKICTEIFDMLEKNTIETGNYAEGGFVNRGIRINPAEKKRRANNSFSLNNIQMYTDMKDLLFFKSLHSLSNAMQYLTADDRFCLNNLFDGMSRLNKGIDKIKEFDGYKVLPLLNYKKNDIEKKAPVKK